MLEDRNIVLGLEKIVMDIYTEGSKRKNIVTYITSTEGGINVYIGNYCCHLTYTQKVHVIIYF